MRITLQVGGQTPTVLGRGCGMKNAAVAILAISAAERSVRKRAMQAIIKEYEGESTQVLQAYFFLEMGDVGTLEGAYQGEHLAAQYGIVVGASVRDL